MIVDISPNLRLLGTAHISTKSVEAVKQQIAEFEARGRGSRIMQVKI